jgi:hypothetical protein
MLSVREKLWIAFTPYSRDGTEGMYSLGFALCLSMPGK